MLVIAVHEIGHWFGLRKRVGDGYSYIDTEADMYRSIFVQCLTSLGLRIRVCSASQSC